MWRRDISRRDLGVIIGEVMSPVRNVHLLYDERRSKVSPAVESEAPGLSLES